MPDYGDERGFRSRGVPADIGRDRAGGFRSSGPPSNIGRDRAGGFGWNDMRQIIDERMPTAELLGDLPGARGVAPWFRGRDRDTTTVPAGFNAPDRFGRMRPSGATNPYAAPIDNNPMRGANIGGGWNMYEGAPERSSPWQPYLLDNMGSGSYLSSKFGGGIDDAAGMNDDARGMIEGAGFEVANLGTDKRTERKLWGLAVNSFPPGTPDMQIQQKWNELKEEYYRRKYGGGSDPGDLGLTLPGRDDIVGLS